MNYTAVSAPRWSDPENTAIDCHVTFDNLGVLPFLASPSDVEVHGREIFARAVAGDFGAIAAAPMPTLAEVQAKARKEVITARDTTITSGFPYLGKTIDSDRDSVMSITGAGVAALAAKAAGLPYSVTWTCADDSTIVLDADGVLGMVVTLAMFADAQHAKARPLKDAIKNAKTPEDIGKVVW